MKRVLAWVLLGGFVLLLLNIAIFQVFVTPSIIAYLIIAVGFLFSSKPFAGRKGDSMRSSHLKDDKNFNDINGMNAANLNNGMNAANLNAMNAANFNGMNANQCDDGHCGDGCSCDCNDNDGSDCDCGGDCGSDCDCGGDCGGSND